jgi:acetyl coenzyme A synthetase (ADP forming)-like protein
MSKDINESIKYLFEPRSIAVIGASNDTSKIGHKILHNIISGGYGGTIYPVNPGGGEILNMKAYRSLDEIDGEIDTASIVIPAKFVIDAVQQCAIKGVKYIQIITSGFSELGNTEEEREIVSIARSHGMRVLGPNIFGIYSSVSSLNATFSASSIPAGNVAILTQSGALGIAMIGKTAVDNMGLSAIVSIGNKCDIDEADLIEYLIPQEETRVILMYIEGVKEGERLITVLERATSKKPVVAIKSGRSKRGAMAAASHTGSLAGSDEIFDAIMRQCGVLRAESIEEAFNWCKFLAHSPKPKGDRGVIVTNGGGIGVMATDACERYDIPLYDDQEVLKEVFEPVTPSFGSTKNPIDITGGARSEDYRIALSAPATSEYMDSTIALYCETATFDSDNLIPMIRETYEKHRVAGKPITYAIVGGADVENSLHTLRGENIPVYSDVYEAVSCLGMLYRYDRYLSERSVIVAEAKIDAETINGIIENALGEGRNFLLANESAAVMRAAGISIPESRVAHNIDEALRDAEEIGYPVVMKIVSRDILHKSDAGGVALDLEDREEVIDAYEAIIHNCKAYNPNAVIDGVEVGEMLQPGIELIIGARRDASFGPIVMCGLGGIYVEVMKDVTFRALPLDRKEALAMLKEIRSYPLLLGVRGEEKKDIDGVIETIIKVGTIISKCSCITDIEINPIVVYEQKKGLKALDARILTRNPKEE